MQQSRPTGFDPQAPDPILIPAGGVATGQPQRPTNFVAAAIPDAASLGSAVAELVAAGIPRDTIAVLQGDRGASTIAETRRQTRSWLDFSDERRYVERYEDEAREGHYVVGVPLPDGGDAMRRTVRRILETNGGHAIVSSGRWTYEIGDR